MLDLNVEDTRSQNNDWRNIAISLIDPDFGEQTAQACENACLRQLAEPRPITQVT